MGTSKDPEGHRQRILDVAQRLFLEKGYDDTSIQDIVDGLGGMTKGAVYYHFPSKSAIFDAVTERMASSDAPGEDWKKGWPGRTGLEKLRNELVISLSAYARHDVSYSAQTLLKSPRMVGEMYLNNMDDIVGVIAPYVQEGIGDGSIAEHDPQDVAQLIFILLNMWIGLKLTTFSKKEVVSKFTLLREMFEGIGVPVVDDRVIRAAVDLHAHLKRNPHTAGKSGGRSASSLVSQ
ncbi:TetR family transcriptional regulator [Bombiscardovia nodaiensis]|uniref:TetR family transcriptional regulator n=1 Tax=Bombiscardovia nodaiensis TaxID=2932181 RepID=A0ABM8B7D2_9BIFI|nr:TetR family transcriptional regulator [Bombiscardovia nodaiensis]